MYTIATLYQLQQHLGLDSGVDDDRLLFALQAASVHIERLAGRQFCPKVATIDHSLDPRRRNELLLSDDLLELDYLSTNDGATYSLDDVLLVPGNDEPSAVIYLTGGNAFTWDDTSVLAASVTGTWGWHYDWSNAWCDSADVVKNASLGASDTTITVADSQAADAESQSPRFQVGQLLQIEDEYLRVLAITVNAGADDTLTVQRAVNGTTAAAHAQNTIIYSYQPVTNVVGLCLRWAAWLYREPDMPQGDGILPAFMGELETMRRVSVRA
jgi:hypothetical protein